MEEAQEGKEPQRPATPPPNDQVSGNDLCVAFTVLSVALERDEESKKAGTAVLDAVAAAKRHQPGADAATVRGHLSAPVHACRRVFGVRCSVCRLCVPSVCHVCVMCRRVPRTGTVGTWPPRPLARWLASHERARATHPLAAYPHLVCLPVVPPSLAAAAPQAYLLASRYLLTLHLASLAEYTLRLARSVMLDSRPPQVRGEVTSRACIHPWQSSGGWFPTQLARPSVALAHRT